MLRKCTRLFPSVVGVDPSVTVNQQCSRHSYWTYSRLEQLRLHQKHSRVLNHTNNITSLTSRIQHYSKDVTRYGTIPDSNPVQESEIKAFFAETDIQFTEGYTCFTTTCLKFVKEGIKPAKMDRLHINRTTGYFVCEVCKKSGSWEDYKENVENIIQCKRVKSYQCLKDLPKTVDKELLTYYDSCHPLESLTEEEKNHIDHYLGIQSLTDATLQKYKVKVTKEHTGLVLPVFNPDGTLVRLRIMTVTRFKVKDKERYRVVTDTLPRGSVAGLFGLHLLQGKSRQAVVTATELDAMAAYQARPGGMLALALPRGDSMLPQNVLPYLEKVESLVLWLGGELREYVAAKQFARKLGEARCSVIRPGTHTPGALAAARGGADLGDILGAAREVRHKCIVSFATLRHEVKDEMEQADHVAGVKWQRYTQLNRLLKGHRRGELTVFTGPTGSGKTTFISDYSVDLAMQGVNTLWGSFEINNVKLLKTMLRQYSQVNLAKNIGEFDAWADKFEQLPMYFMTFHGQESITKVIETMSHAVYVHDIAHVIVDNLQFMMGVAGGSVGAAAMDRFTQQDKLIAAFRNFATHMNCHITLVIHPRKEREEELSMSSIFGSAKASQEADNVIILQDKRLTSIRGKKYVQITKNRFDGDLGIMLLKFNKDTLSFYKEPASKQRTEESTRGAEEL